MATNSNKLTRSASLLPPGVSAFLRRRMLETLGILLAIISIVLAGSLLTYNSLDPSLNAATGSAPSNFFGTIGALLSDFLLQSIGLAACILPLILLGWSWRICTHRGIRFLWVRMIFFPITILAAAISLAGPETNNGWPLNSGFGGVFGDIILHKLGLFVSTLFGALHFLSAGCLGHGAGLFPSDTSFAGPAHHWGHDRPAQSSRAEE